MHWKEKDIKISSNILDQDILNPLPKSMIFLTRVKRLKSWKLDTETRSKCGINHVINVTWFPTIWILALLTSCKSMKWPYNALNWYWYFVIHLSNNVTWQKLSRTLVSNVKIIFCYFKSVWQSCRNYKLCYNS